MSRDEIIKNTLETLAGKYWATQNAKERKNINTQAIIFLFREARCNDSEAERYYVDVYIPYRDRLKGEFENE